MGVNGDVRITTLKQMTGIADNRLSAHNPNGAGNATAMGDFLTAAVRKSPIAVALPAPFGLCADSRLSAIPVICFRVVMRTSPLTPIVIRSAVRVL